MSATDCNTLRVVEHQVSVDWSGEEYIASNDSYEDKYVANMSLVTSDYTVADLESLLKEVK